MAELWTQDVTLNVEVEGEGEPVTVFAHGLTNNADELALFTPSLSGTKVRFDFRGHGRSDSPPEGSYRFADFARDLRAVADAHGATRAVGTSLGAGTMLHLMADEPDRFDRVVFLLPAGLDGPFRHRERYLPMADALESLPLDQAIEAILAADERRAAYLTAPWLEAYDRANFQKVNPVGVPRAIREVTLDWPVQDRAILRTMDAPALLIARDGDKVHALKVAEIMADLLPNAELIAYPDAASMFLDIPNLVPRVASFLAAR